MNDICVMLENDYYVNCQTGEIYTYRELKSHFIDKGITVRYFTSFDEFLLYKELME